MNNPQGKKTLYDPFADVHLTIGENWNEAEKYMREQNPGMPMDEIQLYNLRVMYYKACGDFFRIARKLGEMEESHEKLTNLHSILLDELMNFFDPEAINAAFKSAVQQNLLNRFESIIARAENENAIKH